MEQTFLYFINRDWTHPVLDIVMATVSSWDFWWPIFVVGCGIILFRGGFNGRAMLVCFGLSILFTDALAVRNLKNIVGRPRPHMVVEGVRQVDLAKAKPRILALAKPLAISEAEGAILPVRGGSFPSGHAANNFAIATVVFIFYRKWGWLMFLPAALVAYSRVYVGAHWPVDVFLSAMLGAGISFIVCLTADFVWRKWAGRFVPPIAATHPHLIPV